MKVNRVQNKNFKRNQQGQQNMQGQSSLFRRGLGDFSFRSAFPRFGILSAIGAGAYWLRRRRSSISPDRYTA